MPQGQYLFFQQELISEHFGEDGTSYETEIQELEDLRQVGGLLPRGRSGSQVIGCISV